MVIWKKILWPSHDIYVIDDKIEMEMVLIVIVHKCDAKNGNVFLGNKEAE